MNVKTGLWIDHKEAIIVMLNDGGDVLKHIKSNVEKHTRFTDGSSESGAGEDSRDRKFGNHLNKFYDGVIAAIHGADSLVIFGPGEAKAELAKRMEKKNVAIHVVAIEGADKMTGPQILAKIHTHFGL